MKNIRTRFTYLWLLIVACCVVTKPVVAAPVSAHVVTIKCTVDGRDVNKQILLIGVAHTPDGKKNDRECFNKLSNIIDIFIEKHNDKTMSSIPVLLEASEFQGIHKNVFPVEFNLASKYINGTDTGPFRFIQADPRDTEGIRNLRRYLTDTLNDKKLFKQDWKSCGSVEYYKELYQKAWNELMQSYNLATKDLGLKLQGEKNGFLDHFSLNRIAEWNKVEADSSQFGVGAFALLGSDLYCFRRVLYEQLSNKGSAQDYNDIGHVVKKIGECIAWIQSARLHLMELQVFIHYQVANVWFFSTLVQLLAHHDKIILFCGASHVADGRRPGMGLAPLFYNFGCDVKDIESFPVERGEKDQKYILPSRLQEIFTNFLSCCNTCGKTKACLKDNEKMKSCRPCHAVTYCSRECQITDWKNHKKVSPGCEKKKKKEKK